VCGELRRLNYTKGNTIEASQLGPVTLSDGNTYLNRPAPARAGKGDRALPADPSPLKLFRFFDAAQVGLTFAIIEGAAHVEAVAAGTPFARAGLRRGDRVLAVNGGEFRSQQEFVTLLRRRIPAAEALLKVGRADRILEVSVLFSP
jgi:S1-C subfamily serine protease